MTSKKSFKEHIHTFRTSEDTKIVYAREIAYVLGTVALIVAILYLICGTWPAIVTIESGSMEPHMNIGDLVLVIAPDRFGALQSYTEGEQTGHEKFERPGDVIIFRTNGNSKLHPIIHRALYWSEEGEKHTFYDGARSIEYTAPNAGYITKGDNNPIEDQVGWENYRGLGSPILPVKKEWIVGKAYAKIPYVGYLPLNIEKVIAILILLIIIHELYLRSKEGDKEKRESAKKQKKKSKK
jgi:signal peptidase